MRAVFRRDRRGGRATWAGLIALAVFGIGLAATEVALAGAPVEPPPETLTSEDDAPSDTVTSGQDDQPATTVEPTPDSTAPVTAPADTAESEDGDLVATRPGAAPNVRDSGIALGSIVIAVLVFVAVGITSVVLVRRRPPRTGDAAPSGPTARPRPSGAPSPAPAQERHGVELSAGHADTLEFLLELGEALLDAGDSVGHVESTLRNVAEVNGIAGLGVVALPSSIVLSVEQDDTVATEVRTTTAGALRLDQIDDVLHVVRDAERAAITAAEGSEQLARIRAAEPAAPRRVLIAAYVVSTVGLAMVLRGGLLEVAVAAVLGALVGAFRLATASQRPSYQAFWPLIAATVVSASVFAVARVLDDLTVFPVLVSPLITFLPGGLLTIAVLELSTGQIVSGASRLAAGAMQLVLLALGIVAGAQLVGVPGGDIRAGGEGIVAALVPWVGVGLFGLGVAWFHGARTEAHWWILLVLYVAYAGQVIGGLLFGTALSAFFGAVAMTPTAVLASRQRSGPTPLVTFLPGFWILVPGALGLEGVTRIIGDGADSGAGALVTALTSMIGISLGLLLGLVIAGADPERPWSTTRTRR